MIRSLRCHEAHMGGRGTPSVERAPGYTRATRGGGK